MPRRNIRQNTKSRKPRNGGNTATLYERKKRPRPLDELTAVESAKIQAKMKKEIASWRLVDPIVYATGQTKKAEVVTGDEHFKKLKNVFFIE